MLPFERWSHILLDEVGDASPANVIQRRRSFTRIVAHVPMDCRPAHVTRELRGVPL